MVRRQGQQPKVQRGISLQKDLYERISDTADRLGLSFNAAVEGALSKAFPSVVQDMPITPETRHNRQAKPTVEVA